MQHPALVRRAQESQSISWTRNRKVQPYFTDLKTGAQKMEMPCQGAQRVGGRVRELGSRFPRDQSIAPFVVVVDLVSHCCKVQHRAQHLPRYSAHQKQFINILLKGGLFQKYLRSGKTGIIRRKARGCQGLPTQKHSFSTIFAKGE